MGKKKKEKKIRIPKQKDIGILLGKYNFRAKKFKATDKEAVAPKKIYIPEECGLRLGDSNTEDDHFGVVCPVIMYLKNPIKLDENNFPACLPLMETFDRNTITGGSLGWGQKKFTKAKNAN